MGNLKTMWEGGDFPKTFTFNAADRLVTMVEGANLTTYAYTGYGALESEITGVDTTAYTYSGQDQLIGVNPPNGRLSTYSFDGDGLRRTIQEGNVQATSVVWDGSDYLYLKRPGISPSQMVLTLDSEIVHAGGKDLLTDPLGSLVKEISAGASLGSLIEMYPYGSLVAGTGSATTPYVYIAAYGYFRDTAERDYVRARELYKKLGRWMQLDPLWPDEQAIIYSLSAPTTYFDPSGQSPSDCDFESCFFTGLLNPSNRKTAFAICMSCVQGSYSERYEKCKDVPTKWFDPKSPGFKILDSLIKKCSPCNAQASVTDCCHSISQDLQAIRTAFGVPGGVNNLAAAQLSCECACTDAMKGRGPDGSPSYSDVLEGLQACIGTGPGLKDLLKIIKGILKNL